MPVVNTQHSGLGQRVFLEQSAQALLPRAPLFFLTASQTIAVL